MKSRWDCQKEQVTRGRVILAGGDHDHWLTNHLRQLYPRLKRWRNWACVLICVGAEKPAIASGSSSTGCSLPGHCSASVACFAGIIFRWILSLLLKATWMQWEPSRFEFLLTTRMAYSFLYREITLPLVSHWVQWVAFRNEVHPLRWKCYHSYTGPSWTRAHPPGKSTPFFRKRRKLWEINGIFKSPLETLWT